MPITGLCLFISRYYGPAAKMNGNTVHDILFKGTKLESKFNVPKISIQELSNMQKKIREDDFNIEFMLKNPGKIIETLENLGVPQNIENKAFEIVLRAIYQKITSEIYTSSLDFGK